MKKKKVLPAIFVLALLAFFACERFDADDHKFENRAYLDVSATKQLQLATFSNNLETLQKDVLPLLAFPSEKDVHVTVSVDFSLVQQYNSTYGTSYLPLPETYLDFASQTVTIPAGKVSGSSVSIALKGLKGTGEEQDGALPIDAEYLLPVRMETTDVTLLSGSSVAYFLLKRSSSITVAAQLTDNWINFPTLDQPGPQSDAFNGLTAVTYEALIYVDRFDLKNDFGPCSISSIMGVEQYLLLRIGDTKFERQQLQFDGSGAGTAFGKFPESAPDKRLFEGRWYHVACTYDYANRRACVYVDGKLQSEGKELGTATGGINLAQRALGAADAYQFFIGKSYNDFRPLQGRIAEARVWKVARTPEQIWENMYKIENPEDEASLIGYWKFNEGKGNVIRDYSRNHNDGIAQKDIVWPNDIEIPVINKKEE